MDLVNAKAVSDAIAPRLQQFEGAIIAALNITERNVGDELHGALDRLNGTKINCVLTVDIPPRATGPK